MSDLPERPVVSVILCTYAPDMFEHFRDAAESVLDQTYPRVELVIVVDGNHDVFERIQSRYGGLDAVIINEMGVNRGLLSCRNHGVEISGGDIVAFIDDDAVADDRWIAELVKTYIETDAIAAGGRMIPEWVDEKLEYLPEEFYWLVGVTHKGFPESRTEVRNTFGSNLSFRRDVFEELGGFDTDIGGRKGDKNLQGGETEFCSRMRSMYGRGVMYNPDAVVEHKVLGYRTRKRWLINRAFWQGYSKWAMQKLTSQSADVEGEFLQQLLLEFIPKRIVSIASKPSRSQGSQLAMLLVLTFAVGLGYLYGMVKW